MELTTLERLMLVAAAGSTEGNAATLRRCIHLMDRLELSSAEKVEIGYKETPGGAVWAVDRTWRVDFDANELALLKALFTRQHRDVLALAEKLETRGG